MYSSIHKVKKNVYTPCISYQHVGPISVLCAIKYKYVETWQCTYTWSAKVNIRKHANCPPQAIV